MTFTLRPAVPDDAPALLCLQLQLDRETRFMLLEEGERSSDPAGLRARLENPGPTSCFWLAEQQGEPIGYLALFGHSARRQRHEAYIVVGVLQAASGRGVGSALFQAAERWARERGLGRLELTVMVHNRAAVALYHKMGFVVEGLRRHSLVVDGNPVDEYLMAKLLT
ncbi:RimJ/RimL family protein N-acetyltransferase [Deinobacterium chartae]|uniref:RimJ/RimL family protein N-acetyltransferase n=1 Tax=Deinobacterium chartae TaxID=521158 RepID=A0A841HZN8_9DEIO|nr:GNAT family N-acetyltransferase [Deinobacterium chartae]MBB6098867.1 RimJ/RimL family protein N-acetyltransferase [Deinobacterium chartae]